MTFFRARSQWPVNPKQSDARLVLLLQFKIPRTTALLLIRPEKVFTRHTFITFQASSCVNSKLRMMPCFSRSESARRLANSTAAARRARGGRSCRNPQFLRIIQWHMKGHPESTVELAGSSFRSEAPEPAKTLWCCW